MNALARRSAGVGRNQESAAHRRSRVAPSALIDHYLEISRLLAGQLDLGSAIHTVSAEVAHILPHDHLDVCLMTPEGACHTAYETGIRTLWSEMQAEPVAHSPIRALLWGEVEHLLTDDACQDPRFHFPGALTRPILEQSLRSRVHVPMKVQGEIIGALSCSSREGNLYGMEEVAYARAVADLLSPYFFALQAAERAQRSAIVEAEVRAREEGLRLGALKLTEALEQERQRIGMDLHDQTLADLTRLTRRVESLSRTGDITAEALEPLSRSLQDCMQDLRNIIEQARPSVLQLFGLAQAVENHLERSVRDSGLPVTWEVTDETDGACDSLDASVGIALFRIAQEAINNAVRHAGPAHIRVNLSLRPEGLTLDILDNGEGAGAQQRRQGGGIDNMMTRARLISARFSLSSGPQGQGTQVRVVLPPPAAAGGGAAS